MSRDRFNALDGTLCTWSEALTIFRDLIGLVEPCLLLIVIYDIEVLDHNATQDRLGALLEELRAAMLFDNIGRPPRLLKILFVTSGASHVLCQNLHPNEMYDMNRGSVTLSPGRAKKGRQSMGSVHFG